MQIAQRLYQGIDIEGDTVGLITYMRTDGTNISNDAVTDFRNFIKKIMEIIIYQKNLTIILEKKQKMHKKPTKRLDQQIFQELQKQ